MSSTLCIGAIALLAACSAKDGSAEPPLLWVRAPYTHETFIVADPPDERWLSGPPREVEGEPYAAERDLALEAMPAVMRERIGQTVDLMTTSGRLTFRSGRVRRLRALVRLTPPERSEKLAREPAGPGRAALIWRIGHPALVAEIPIAFSTPEVAFVVEPDRVIKRLVPAESSEVDPARKALRTHALWDIQEDAYQASLRQADIAPDDILHSQKVPAHWDLDADGRPTHSVTTWRDALGQTVLQSVAAGNRIACAAPPTWSFWSDDYGASYLWGIEGWAPTAVMDVDVDGEWEAVFDDRRGVVITRLASDGAPLAGRVPPDWNLIECDDDRLQPPSGK